MVARKKAPKVAKKKKTQPKPAKRRAKPAPKKRALRAKTSSAKKSSAKKSSAKRAAPKRAATKKPTARKPAAKRRAATEPVRAPVRREDHAGHLDPRYVAELRAQSGGARDEDRAFFAQPRSGDDLAEELGEEMVGAATSGEAQGEDAQDQVVEEERGGPFVETPARVEYDYDPDESNPEDAEREPFPTT